MSKIAADPVRTRRKRSDVVGVTSDGVRILRQVRGRRNLTDAQINRIVEGLIEARRRREAELDATE